MAEASSTARERAKEKDQDVDKAAGGEEPTGQKAARKAAADTKATIDAEPLEVANGDAALIRGDDSIEDYIEDADTATYVVVKKDVVEEFFYPDTKRPAHRLAYKAGQVVLRSELEERLLLIRSGGTAVTKENPAGVDQTTLASGTYPGVTEVVAQEQSPLGTTSTT